MKGYTDISINNKKYAYRLAGSRYGLSLFLSELDNNGELSFDSEYKTTLPFMSKSMMTDNQIKGICEDMLKAIR